jgi:hypothetical protein
LGNANAHDAGPDDTYGYYLQFRVPRRRQELNAWHVKIRIEPQSAQRAQSIKNQAAALYDLYGLCGRVLLRSRSWRAAHIDGYHGSTVSSHTMKLDSGRRGHKIACAGKRLKIDICDTTHYLVIERQSSFEVDKSRLILEIRLAQTEGS